MTGVRTPSRWATVVIVAGIVAILIVLATRAPTSDVASLRERPQASVYFPGSVLLREGGREGTAPYGSAIWKQLGTDASFAEVLDWYDRELAARGLQPGGGSSGIPAWEEFQVCAWHSDDIVFRLGFLKMDKWSERYPGSQPYPTVYELRLIEVDEDLETSKCARTPA